MQQQWLTEKKAEITKRYGTALDFALAFNPDIQSKCASNVERSLTGDAPTIRQLLATYTTEQVRIWLIAQFENLNVFTGVNSKMAYEQMLMLADIITTDYLYLKASEILLFFHQFKAGNHGALYGSVDPMKVTEGLHSFLKWRATELDKIESRRRESRRIKLRSYSFTHGVTRGNYLKRKFHRLGKKHNVKRKK